MIHVLFLSMQGSEEVSEVPGDPDALEWEHALPSMHGFVVKLDDPVWDDEYNRWLVGAWAFEPSLGDWRVGLRFQLANGQLQLIGFECLLEPGSDDNGAGLLRR